MNHNKEYFYFTKDTLKRITFGDTFSSKHHINKNIKINFIVKNVGDILFYCPKTFLPLNKVNIISDGCKIENLKFYLILTEIENEIISTELNEDTIFRSRNLLIEKNF